MYIVDDFLPYFEETIKREHLFQFYALEDSNKLFNKNERWRGTRTGNIVMHTPGLTNYIEAKLQISLKNLHFHKHDAMPDVTPRLHRDGDFKTAGVIYLRGGPGCGTEVEERVAEFKENRLVTYSAQLMHRPQGFTHPRMVITFFSLDVLPKNLPL